MPSLYMTICRGTRCFARRPRCIALGGRVTASEAKAPAIYAPDDYLGSDVGLFLEGEQSRDGRVSYFQYLIVL